MILVPALAVLFLSTTVLLSNIGGNNAGLECPAMTASSNIIDQSNGIALCIMAIHVSIAIHYENCNSS